MKTIAYITDIHLDEGLLEEYGVDSYKQWALILDDVRARGISEIVFGGDIGADSAHEWFFNSVKDFDFKYVLGNHDTFEKTGRYFEGSNAGNNALYYTSEDDEFKTIFLDTSTEQMDDAQFNWLKSQLNTDKPVLIFIHHSIFGVATPIDSVYPLHGRERIAGRLQQSGKQVTIFCGHYHMEDAQQTGKISQYVTPASSYQITKHASAIEPNNSTFGYRLITVAGGKIETVLLMYRNGSFVMKQEKFD